MKRTFEIRVINDPKTEDIPVVELWLLTPVKIRLKQQQFTSSTEFANAWRDFVTEKAAMESKYNKGEINNPVFPRAVKEQLAIDIKRIMELIESNEYYPKVRNL